MTNREIEPPSVDNIIVVTAEHLCLGGMPLGIAPTPDITDQLSREMGWEGEISAPHPPAAELETNAFDGFINSLDLDGLEDGDYPAAPSSAARPILILYEITNRS